MVTVVFDRSHSCIRHIVFTLLLQPEESTCKFDYLDVTNALSGKISSTTNVFNIPNENLHVT
jgi:hypothetical protein